MMDVKDMDRNCLSPEDYKTVSSNKDNKISCRNCDIYRRDSGYGTDSSPSATKSKLRQFTFNYETEHSENESTNYFENMDLHTDIEENEGDLNDDVFIDNYVPCDKRNINYDSDSADKEVENLLGELGNLHNVYNTGVNKRPVAPVPTSRNCPEENKRIKDSPEITLRQFCDQRICYCRNYYFRPISGGGRNPLLPPVNQITESDAGLGNKLLCRCHSFHFSNGDITGRVRLRSEGVERGISGSLPDVVPDQYKRPVSLPDLVDLQRQTEQETGRELRRIGDEFDSYYNERKTSTISWNIFACSINFRMSGYLKTIQRLLSPNPQKCIENR